MSLYGDNNNFAMIYATGFDKIYPNRVTMEANQATDGIGINRFVLIRYGDDVEPISSPSGEFKDNLDIDIAQYWNKPEDTTLTGYHATVWQKIYSDGNWGYQLICSLDTPVFKISEQYLDTIKTSNEYLDALNKYLEDGLLTITPTTGENNQELTITTQLQGQTDENGTVTVVDDSITLEFSEAFGLEVDAQKKVHIEIDNNKVGVGKTYGGNERHAEYFNTYYDNENDIPVLGPYSHTIGENNQALGEASFAGGSETTVSGKGAFGFGIGNQVGEESLNYEGKSIVLGHQNMTRKSNLVKDDDDIKGNFVFGSDNTITDANNTIVSGFGNLIERKEDRDHDFNLKELYCLGKNNSIYSAAVDEDTTLQFGISWDNFTENKFSRVVQYVQANGETEAIETVADTIAYYQFKGTNNYKQLLTKEEKEDFDNKIKITYVAYPMEQDFWQVNIDIKSNSDSNYLGALFDEGFSYCFCDKELYSVGKDEEEITITEGTYSYYPFEEENMNVIDGGIEQYRISMGNLNFYFMIIKNTEVGNSSMIFSEDPDDTFDDSNLDKKLVLTSYTPPSYVDPSNTYLLGSNLLSTHSNQIILGNYNEDKENVLFAIGNGTSSKRKNILEITKENKNENEKLLFNNGTVDYIVEQQISAESNKWSYRKWASGVAECWIKGKVLGESISTNNSDRGLYSSETIKVALPFQTLLGKSFNILLNDPGVWAVEGNDFSKSEITFRIMRANSGTLKKPTANIFVIGKW